MSTLIEPVAYENMKSSLKEAFRARVERLGYLGDFYRCSAYQPEALAHFDSFTNAAKTSIEPKLVELIALTVASRFEVAYERNQHERLSVRLGYGRAWVRDIVALDPNASHHLDSSERDLQHWLLAAIERHGRDSDGEAAAFFADMPPNQVVGIMFVAMRFIAHAFAVNMLGLISPVPSIFEDEFGEDKISEKQVTE